MLAAYNVNAPKQAVNLRINGDLLNQAKAFNINLSQTLERALVDVVKQNQRTQWLEENRNAIIAYNEHVECNGAFSDNLRHF